MCGVTHRPAFLNPTRRRPRGIAAIVALLFVALLSVLSLGIYSSTHLATQVVTTQRRVDVAQLAAESGMEFIRQQLASISIPYNTAASGLFAQVAIDLQSQINASATLSLGNLESDALTQMMYVPARSAAAIPLGNSSGSFRCEVKQVGTQLTVKTTGFDAQGQLSRDIQLSYAVATRASNIFDFGVASKGPITLNGNVKISGTTGNPQWGSVLVVSDDLTTPLSMIGNCGISGDVSLTRSNNHSIAIATMSKIFGYSQSSSLFWDHVHADVKEPEFPIIDTSIFAPFATTVITASGGAGGAVGGAGTAAGFVGLDSVNLQNNCVIQGFDSVNSATLGSVSILSQTNGGGNVNGTTFKGEYQYKTNLAQNGSTFTKVTKVTSTLSFVQSTTPTSGVTNKGNYNGPSGLSETWPAGKYYLTSFTVPAGKTLIFSGPVELYINGACNVTGNITAYNNFAGNVKIRMVCSAGVDLNSSTGALPLYLDVYAPTSPLNINNRTNVNGSFIMKSISVSNATVNIDRAVKASGGATAVPTETTGTATSSTVTTLSGNNSYSNLLIKANANPKFTGNITVKGVVYIETPNKVEFAGNLALTGVIAVQTDGNNNIGLDPASNTIAFKGNVTALPPSSLDNTFSATLRNLNGGFVLAPGFGVSFTGNFGTIGGSIVASKLDFSGNAGGTVVGTVINLNNTPFTLTGNADITIQSSGTGSYPAGVYFGSRFDPLPATYVEVTP